MTYPAGLTPPPTWLLEMAEQTSGWRWLEMKEREAMMLELRERYSGSGPAFVPLKPEIVRLCQLLLERLQPVATLPIAPRRPDVLEHQAIVFTEIARPAHVIVAVHQEIPPLLWFPAGATAQQLHEQLEPYLLETAAPAAIDLPVMRRAFLGTPGILELERDELLVHWSSSPLAESLFWGGAHERDPWPEQISAEQLPELSERAALYMAQHPQGPWSLSFRAIASRAILSFEDHDGMFTLQLHYTPARHAPLITALNEQFQQSWPLDLPADVCALLIGLSFETPDRLLDRLDAWQAAQSEEELQSIAFELYALAATMRGDLSWIPRLRPLLHGPTALREVIADLALRHQLDFLLTWLLDTSPDAPDAEELALRQAIFERL